MERCPFVFFFSSRRRHTRCGRDWSSDCALPISRGVLVRPFATPDVPEELLWQIVAETINFPVKLVSLSPALHILELFHGPTLAFKDFGARFMARLMGYFVRGEERQLTVLVATSGDTGSAVAHGF